MRYDGAMRLAVILLVAACTRGSSHGSRTVTVTAFAGEREEPGAIVIGHAANGDVIDETTTDAVGTAEVGIDDGALISIVFGTSVLSVVTTPAPDGGLVVHGPPNVMSPPLVVGALQIDAPALSGATYYDVDLGCVTVRETGFPAVIDIGACSTGSDSRLDVLVRGYHDAGGDPPAPVLDGYAAARVQMLDGVAQLTIASWETSTSTVPVVLDGVAPYVTLTLLADHLPFETPAVTDHAQLWTGLVVDASRVEAALLGAPNTARMTTRELVGAPTAIQLGAADFLPEIAVTASVASQDPLALTWDAAGIGDAANLHATWQVDQHHVVWDAVLPPDATGVTLPAVADVELVPAELVPVDVVLRYIDGSDHADFAALVAAGIHAEATISASTIAVRPIDGEIRTSHAIGLR